MRKKTNEEIIRQLEKLRAVDLEDPIARSYLINTLSGNTNQQEVRAAVNAYRGSFDDKVINTDNERERLAVMITRQGRRARKRVPLARAASAAKGVMRKRRYNFKQSSGKGIRKFDGTKSSRGWNGYRIADAKTKFDANRLAKFLRKNQPGRVRVIEYQGDKKTHYSVYSENIVAITNQSYIDGIKKIQAKNKKRRDPIVDKIVRRANYGDALKQRKKSGLNRSYTSNRVAGQDGIPILTTKKRLPEIGLKLRVI